LVYFSPFGFFWTKKNLATLARVMSCNTNDAKTFF
jgi:hypothetical protein